ncbi:hypothetical protein GGH96_003570, partial [Coemansia sp. RSA 1972]
MSRTLIERNATSNGAHLADGTHRYYKLVDTARDDGDFVVRDDSCNSTCYNHDSAADYDVEYTARYGGEYAASDNCDSAAQYEDGEYTARYDGDYAASNDGNYAARYDGDYVAQCDSEYTVRDIHDSVTCDNGAHTAHSDRDDDDYAMHYNHDVYEDGDDAQRNTVLYAPTLGDLTLCALTLCDLTLCALTLCDLTL